MTDGSPWLKPLEDALLAHFRFTLFESADGLHPRLFITGQTHDRAVSVETWTGDTHVTLPKGWLVELLMPLRQEGFIYPDEMLNIIQLLRNGGAHRGTGGGR